MKLGFHYECLNHQNPSAKGLVNGSLSILMKQEPRVYVSTHQAVIRLVTCSLLQISYTID